MKKDFVKSCNGQKDLPGGQITICIIIGILIANLCKRIPVIGKLL